MSLLITNHQFIIKRWCLNYFWYNLFFLFFVFSLSEKLVVLLLCGDWVSAFADACSKHDRVSALYGRLQQSRLCFCPFRTPIPNTTEFLSFADACSKHDRVSALYGRLQQSRLCFCPFRTPIPITTEFLSFADACDKHDWVSVLCRGLHQRRLSFADACDKHDWVYAICRGLHQRRLSSCPLRALVPNTSEFLPFVDACTTHDWISALCGPLCTANSCTPLNFWPWRWQIDKLNTSISDDSNKYGYCYDDWSNWIFVTSSFVDELLTKGH